MKNVYVVITLLFLASIPLLTTAQAPGYLGRRAFIGFTFSSSPAISGPTQNNNGENFFGNSNDRSWGINYELEANLSYVISRSMSLGLNLGQYYTGMTTTAETPSLARELLPFQNDYFDSHDLFYRLNVKSLSIVVNKYKLAKGALAPFGNHVFFGLKRHFISGEIIDKRTTYESSFEEIGNVVGHRNLEIDDQLAYFSFLFGWARNQIFWDKFILKTGIRFAIPLGVAPINAIFDNNAYEPFERQELYEDNVYNRLVRHEFVRVDVGVGFLIF
ncbi:MAG: hypothetical protein AAGG75_22315 [Bacteroidota bacterium]